jgi:hypothetical protein
LLVIHITKEKKMAKTNKLTKQPYEILSMETALLISTAPTKSIDISLWFNEKLNYGKLVQKDFDSRLISLAKTMSIGQDEETKKELELAISPLALRIIHSLCASGEEEVTHQPFINVSYFVSLCDERVNSYLAEMEEGEDENEEDNEEKDSGSQKKINFRSWEAGEYDIEGNLIQSVAPPAVAGSVSDKKKDTVTHEQSIEESLQEDIRKEIENSLRHQQQHEHHHRYGDDDHEDEDFLHMSAEDYIEDIRKKALSGERPVSAPSGRRSVERGETTEETLQFSKDDNHRVSSYARDAHHPSAEEKQSSHTTEGGKKGITLVTAAAGATSKQQHQQQQPPSPYDEEIAFNPYGEDGDEDDDVDTAEYLKSEQQIYKEQRRYQQEALKQAAVLEREREENRAAASNVARQQTHHRGARNIPFDINVTDIPGPKKTTPTAASNFHLHSNQRGTGKGSRNTKGSNGDSQRFHEENHRFLMASGGNMIKEPLTGAKRPTSAATTNRPSLTASEMRQRGVNATQQGKRPVTQPATQQQQSGMIKPRPSSVDPKIRANSRFSTPNRAVGGTFGASSRPFHSANKGVSTAAAVSSSNYLRTRSADHLTRRGIPSTNEDERNLSSSSNPLLPPEPPQGIPLPAHLQRFRIPGSSGVDDKRRNSFSGFRSSSAGAERGRRSAGGGGAGGVHAGYSSMNQSFPHFKPSELTFEEIASLKDINEDLIRNVVRKTDLYHLLQVSLGYIDDYTLIPPRGSIIISKEKEWLNDRDIHTAFLTARLFLNDQQLWILKGLVNDFAKEYRSYYEDRIEKLIKLPGESNGNGNEEKEKLPKSAKGPGNTLNNEWLKKYLIHLRLSKRIVSSQSNRTLLPNETQKEMKELVAQTLKQDEEGKVVTGEDGEREEKEEKETTIKNPIPWKEWLAKKLQLEMVKGPFKPKEFAKILSGNCATTLGKEEIELYLRNHSILPEEALMQEIEYRIEGWILDMDGRRDFQHQLNMKIRTYIWEELIMKQQGTLSTVSRSLFLSFSQVQTVQVIIQRFQLMKSIIGSFIIHFLRKKKKKLNLRLFNSLLMKSVKNIKQTKEFIKKLQNHYFGIIFNI